MYYFIVNPNSRSGKGELIWKELRQVLRQKHISYKAVFTKYRGHAVKLAAALTEKASLDRPLCLIAVGGDGTIQEVLSGCLLYTSPSPRDKRQSRMPSSA